MPIEKGEPWGQPGTMAPDAAVADSDRQASTLLATQQRVIAVQQGDLARTLGVRAPFERGGTKQLLPVDAIHVQLDGGKSYQALAHVIVGHPLRSAHWVAIMNAAFLQGRNLAPRAHPGDGRLDVVSATLKPTDRIKAWRRARTGTHVPHPGIKISRVPSGQVTMNRAQSVRVDGELVGRARVLSYHVEQDAITIAV